MILPSKTATDLELQKHRFRYMKIYAKLLQIKSVDICLHYLLSYVKSELTYRKLCNSKFTCMVFPQS